MRKIIGIVIASMVFANIAFAKIRLIEDKKIKIEWSWDLDVRTLCIDGYKFVSFGSSMPRVAYPSEEAYRNALQFYEERDGKSLPAKCK